MFLTTRWFLIFLGVSALVHATLLLVCCRPNVQSTEIPREAPMTVTAFVTEVPLPVEPPPSKLEMPLPLEKLMAEEASNPPAPSAEEVPIEPKVQSRSESAPIPPSASEFLTPLPVKAAPPRSTATFAAAASESTAASASQKNSPASSRKTASTGASSTSVARPDHRGNPPPPYPEIARRNGWKGTVLIRAQVNAQGRVTSVKLHRSSGHAVLDEAALQAVRGWRFIPRRENGGAVDSEIEVPVNFDLRRR